MFPVKAGDVNAAASVYMRVFGVSKSAKSVKAKQEN